MRGECGDLEAIVAAVGLKMHSRITGELQGDWITYFRL